jgi:hypothetical protein
MSTLNKSTGFFLFQLQMGQMPCILPPLVTHPEPMDDVELFTMEIIKCIQKNTTKAQDNLFRAKILQSVQANKSHTLTFPSKDGKQV